jgi:hypothetical protein
MDGQRFDEITKALATGASRRQILRGVVAGLVGALASGLSREHAAAARRCKGAGGKCTADRDCCQDDPARCADGKCCPKPRYCASTGTCCPPGLKCCGDGECTAGSCRKAQGEACTAGTECASSFCVDGVCCDAACAGECEACTLADSLGTCVPVSGATCTGGVCVEGACCLGRQVNGCDAETLQLCCQDEPCCPFTGECCTDCFTNPEGVSPYLCCPATSVCGNQCCYDDETCAESSPGSRRCYNARLVCDDGRVCPEECCGGVCCGSDQFCHNGTCLTTDTSACTTNAECPTGEQCVGVTLEVVPPSGPDGEETIVANPGSCCPSTRVCNVPTEDAGQPGGPPADHCCGYGSRCDIDDGSCCQISDYLLCGGACRHCSPRGTRTRF